MREQTNSLQIETIKTSGGNEVSACPSRGGIITSLKLKGTGILYLDEGTFLDTNSNVRGGIPILFPNAGALESEKFPRLKQHGFARNSKGWSFEPEEEGRGLKETLVFNDETKVAYPYDFKLTVRGVFEDNGSFSLFEEISNMEADKDIPVSMGFHPYFKVSDNKKRGIRFEFIGGEIFEREADKWMNGQMVSIDNPKLKDGNSIIKVAIPDLGTIHIDASPIYKKIWVWSLPGKDFVCIEPAMRDPGGIVDDPEMVKTGSSLSAHVNFSLE